MVLFTVWEWLGSRVASVLDSGTEGPGFKSQSLHCRVTVVGKLFTPLCLCSPSSKIGSSPLKGCGGNCGPGGKKWQPTDRFMTHDTCRLTAKNRDQLRNPTLGNRVWVTFTFLFTVLSCLPSEVNGYCNVHISQWLDLTITVYSIRPSYSTSVVF